MNKELKNYLTGFKAPEIEQGHISKLNQIKKAKKKEADIETLIRKFNLKRFDDVIKGLKTQSKHVIRPS
jgi:hypothetical protein